MNLLSPITKITASQVSSATSGSIIVSLWDDFTASPTYTIIYNEPAVADADGNYYINLVPILASYFSPSLNEENQNFVVRFRLDFNPSGTWINIIWDERFYYSVDNSYSTQYIFPYFVPDYQFPVSYFDTNKRVDIDGTLRSLQASFPWMAVLQPQTSLIIDNTEFTRACQLYQFSYINARGMWSVFVPQGNCFRTDNIDRSTALMRNEYASYARNVTVPYMSKVTPTFTLNTGWMTEAQASLFASDFLNSNLIYLECPDFDELRVVNIVDAQANYMSPLKDSLMNYEFTVNMPEVLIKY